MNTSPSSTGTTKQRISRLFTYKRPWLGKLVLFTWITFLGIIVGVPLYIYSVKVDLFGLYGGMPSIREVENPENVLTSNLISADGVVLGGYFRNNSSQITYDDLSEDLVATLLYSEDHRYYQHSGLDFVAFLRVIKGVITFNNAGGGSTITQQLAKNLYTRNPNQSLDGPIARLGGYPRRIVQKTKEWIISVDLESYFTKEEIMAMYLNTVGLFSDTYGIKVAAQTYFNKSTDSLNLIESATLVGMLQNPSRFNPVYYPDNAIRKRNEVLKKLQNFGYKIKSDNEYDSLASLPLGLDYNIQNHNEGLATYFRSVMTNYLMQWCNERNIDLWNSGIRIYTTIDSRLQQYAEEAMTEHMREYQKLFEEQLNGRNPWVDDDGKEIQGYVRSRVRRTATYRNLVEEYGRNSDSIEMVLRRKKPMRVFSWEGEIDTLLNSYDSMEYYLKFLQAGFMAMDPTTGYIKAWVGGIDHKYFQYDHVKQGTRQPGSTFKPFVYGLAMENGYSPFQPMEDVAPTFYMDNRPPYTPSNADGTLGSGEIMTLRQAMARSVNSITAQLLKQLGPENVVEFAHRMGISSKLDAVPSLSLGVSDVSLFELVGAYSTYANGGKYTEPFYITRIEDKNGNVLDNFVKNTKEAISEQTAYKMLYMLMGGVEEEGGTSRGLNMELKIDNEIGGKTGTTNNASDGWYMGVTQNLVVGVWVGGDERAIHFPNWTFGQGGRSARPIFEKFMLKVYADSTTSITKTRFRQPASGLDITLDPKRYQIIDGDSVAPQTPWDLNP